MQWCKYESKSKCPHIQVSYQKIPTGLTSDIQKVSKYLIINSIPADLFYLKPNTLLFVKWLAWNQALSVLL